MNLHHVKAFGFFAVYCLASIFFALSGLESPRAALIAGPIEGLYLAIRFGVFHFSFSAGFGLALAMAVDWLAGAIFLVWIGLKQQWETGEKFLACFSLGVFWILSMVLSAFGLGVLAAASV